jgi:hypothetical protein
MTLPTSDPDPQDVVESPDYVAPDADLTPDPITDPTHPDYVEPAELPSWAGEL